MTSEIVIVWIFSGFLLESVIEVFVSRTLVSTPLTTLKSLNHQFCTFSAQIPVCAFKNASHPPQSSTFKSSSRTSFFHLWLNVFAPIGFKNEQMMQIFFQNEIFGSSYIENDGKR